MTAPSEDQRHDRSAPPLVDAAWLRAHLDAPDVRVLHVDADASAYHRGHVPGAVAVDAHDDLHALDRRGPLGQADFELLCRRLGVRRDTHVVLYGAQGPDHAAYAFWLFRYYRHPRLSLLDGGLDAWRRAGGRVTDVPPRSPSAGTYRSPGPLPSLRVSRHQVLQDYVSAAPPRVLVDCRSPQEYAGHSRHVLDLPLDRGRVAGHIPGARSLPASEVLTEAGQFVGRETLLRLVRAAGVGPGSDVATYCRTVERSSLVWFVLHELLGHASARRYDGGWAEYSALVDAPVIPPLAGGRPDGRQAQGQPA